MKTILSITTIAALAASGTLSAQTAYSKPSGYISLGDTTAGQPAVKANTDAFISVPLLRPAVYTATVASVSGSVITLSGSPNLTPNTYVSTTTPYMVVVENGTASGLIGLITANTSNTISLSLQPGETTSGITLGNSITVRLAWTLSSVFSGNTIPNGTLVSVYGNASGINVLADAIYEYDGGWIDSGTLDPADSIVIYPNEGIRLRSPAATPITTLNISGEVPTARSRVVLSKQLPSVGQDNIITFTSPTDTAIGSSGFGSTAGDLLIANNNSTAGINKTASVVLEYTGFGWEDTGTLEDVTNTFLLKAGVSYTYRRSANAPVGSVVASAAPTYVSGL